jgi:UDP-glucose 4-epimerase
VLVTGASGLIGRQVVSRLHAGDTGIEKIVAADIRPLPEKERLDGVDYCSVDIRDAGIADLLGEHAVDTIVHLAAIVSPGKDMSRDEEYAIDVLGTGNVLECALRAGVRQFVYTSSGAAYGYHADNDMPLVESSPLRGNEEFSYSHHKRLVEEMLARTRDEHPELAQLVFRPGTILGSRVANQITAIFERPLVVGVAGSDAPFVMIWDEDVAKCIVKGIVERRNGIYNLTGDGAITLPEIARRVGKPYLPIPSFVIQSALRIAKAAGITGTGPEQVRFLRYRPVLSNERLKTEFGFTPTYTSEECFERYRQIRFGP